MINKGNRSVFVLVLLVTSISLGAQPDQEKILADDLMNQLVGFCKIVLEEMDPAQPGVCYARMPEEHNQSPCYPLAYLYKTEHPLNPFFGNKEIRDQAIAICDHIVKEKSVLEWPLYSLSQVYGLLEEELDEGRRQSWLAYASYYLETRGIRPFFYTSFNHEAWNAMAILRAGQVFSRSEWIDRATGMMHQLIKVQNKLGYFDEGPHHGPSMKYNQAQLAPMLLFVDYTGDQEVLASAKKLADFMIRYSFPDGSLMSCFDGRQDWYIGYFGSLCYGMDRWAMGKEHNRRIWQTRKKWGIFSTESPFYSLSDWYAYFAFNFLLDEYLSLKPDAPVEALPQDSDAYFLYEESSSFAGGFARKHRWITALSAINSSIPKIGNSTYRLERQSRLDIWHEKPGLIIGGGHNMKESEVPLANFHVLTGYNEVDCDFGRLTGGSWYDKLAVYTPRALNADISLERQVLKESFGQGDVSFTVTPLDEENLQILFSYDLFSVKELYVQLPLIVYYNTGISIDGRALENKDRVHELVDCVELSNPTTESLVRIDVPEGFEVALRPPVQPLRWYAGDHGAQRFEPFYDIRLLSVRIKEPEKRGSGEFRIKISNLH